MFGFLLVFSVLIILSSYSWMMMWIGLEINFIAIIPLMKMKSSTESMLVYFIIQVISSSIIIFSFISLMSLSQINYSDKEYFVYFINFALFLKVGMIPLHFWLIPVIEGLSWTKIMMMMTWQKVGPLVMLMFFMKQNFAFIFIFLSFMFSGIFSLNQSSLRKIMLFSGINNLSWLVLTVMLSKSLFFTYLIVYTFINMSVFTLFSSMNINYLSQINFSSMKIITALSILNLTGLPPLSGFYLKWLTIQFLIEKCLYFICIFGILSSLLMIFSYLRIFIMIFTKINLNFSLKLSMEMSAVSVWIFNLLFFPLLLLMTYFF
uniref:NADH-ubiquinone oxidoreductase chain 2 n=1 Tax=Cerophytidae sp. BMNH 900085 TaxID=1903808 RepID=A0A343A4I3_9COLE|nr:NADH dehydrogenase subunit 2 [Cerophytidae sp. BMNH 900085]